MPNKSKATLSDALQGMQAVPSPATSRTRPRSDSAPARKARNKRGAGTRIISGHFAAETHKQLRILAAVEERTIQGLLEEALNDLFRKHKLPPIA